MRAVSHLFLSRSRAAVFWFLVTIGVFAFSAFELQKVMAEVRMRPQFVMANSSSLYYLEPDLEVETPTEMHSRQTRLAMETIFNRTPSRLDNQERFAKLFTPEARRTIIDRIITPQFKTFGDNKLHQKVEIEEVIVNIEEGEGVARTVATGQLIRNGVTGDRIINETWTVRMFFTWHSNPDHDDHGMYPTVCDSIPFDSANKIFP